MLRDRGVARLVRALLKTGAGVSPLTEGQGRILPESSTWAWGEETCLVSNLTLQTV